MNYKIVSAIASYRRLCAIMLDGAMDCDNFVQYFESAMSLPASSVLSAFSCTALFSDMEALVRSIADVFPSLTFLNVFIETWLPFGQVATLEVTRVCLMLCCLPIVRRQILILYQVLLRNLTNCLVLLPKMHVVSVNSWWCTCSTLEMNIETLVWWATPVVHRCPGFQQFLFLCVSFTQEHEYGTWVVECVKGGKRLLLGLSGLMQTL